MLRAINRVMLAAKKLRGEVDGGVFIVLLEVYDDLDRRG